MYLLIAGEFTADAERVRARDKRWMVPLLFRSEFLNVLSSHVRFLNMPRDTAIKVFRRGIAMVKFADDEPDETAILNLSSATNCTTYDAELVHLSEQLDVPLVTEDLALLRAFPDRAVRLSEFATGRSK